MAQLLTVRLSKADQQPLGFRLQGGKDFGTPLVVQKVNGGSAAERAGLQAGDALIRVNNTEVYTLRHQEAQDAIRASGATLELTVQRGGSTWKPSVTPTGSLPRPNSRPLGATPSPVTTTSLKATPQPNRAFGSGHNNVAKPFGYMNGSDSVKGIVNKQYNTPVNMYSDQSIAETLSAQTEVLAGGVLGVNFKKNEKTYDAEKSAVFKVLQEAQNDPEPEVVSAGANPTVAGLRHVQAPVTRPDAPINNTGGLPPGQNICEDCERLITGVFVRIKDKNLHVECFKCATCGSSLKNQGYYNLNGKLYCDIHAKLIARQNPPSANLEPVTVPPGGRLPSNYSTPLPPLSTNNYTNGSSSMFSPSSNISGPKPFSSSMGSAYSPSLSPRSAPLSPARPVAAPMSPARPAAAPLPTYTPAPPPAMAPPSSFAPTNECVPLHKPEYKSAAEERLIRKMAKMALNGYEIGIQRKLKPADSILSMAEKIQDTVVTKHPLNTDFLNNEKPSEPKRPPFKTNDTTNRADNILNIGDMIKDTIMSKHPALNKANSSVPPSTNNIPIPPPLNNMPIPPPLNNMPIPPPLNNIPIPPPLNNMPVPPPIHNTPTPPPFPNKLNGSDIAKTSTLASQPKPQSLPSMASVPSPPPIPTVPPPSSNVSVSPPIPNTPVPKHIFSDTLNNTLMREKKRDKNDNQCEILSAKLVKESGIGLDKTTKNGSDAVDQNNKNKECHVKENGIITNCAKNINGIQNKSYQGSFNGFDKTDTFEKLITNDHTSTPKADLNKFGNTLSKRNIFEKKYSDATNSLPKNFFHSNVDMQSNVFNKINTFERSSNSNSEKSYSSDEENKKPSLNLHDNSLYHYKPVKSNGTNNSSPEHSLNGDNHQNDQVIEDKQSKFTNGDNEWRVKRRERNVDRSADGKRDSHIIARPKSTITAIDVTDGMVPICNVCDKEITRGPFITALGRIWCPDHFICVNATCRRQLQDIGFVEENGQLYCEFCFEQYIAPACDKCHAKIKGDCLNAIGKHYHPECFNCVYCGKLFGNNPFFLEDGLPYCESDWNELFTTKCFACGFPVEAGDRWVEALNNNYHSQCFNCTVCKRNLEGQSFFAKGGRPFCKQHAR